MSQFKQWQPGPYEPGQKVEHEGYAFEMTEAYVIKSFYKPSEHPRRWRNLGRVDQIEALVQAEYCIEYWCRVRPFDVGEMEADALEAIRTALLGIEGEEETT